MCCTVAPKKPSTYSKLDTALEEESRVELELLAEQEARGAKEVR